MTELDQHIFQLINQQWTNGLFDIVMPFVRDKVNWIPLYIVLVIFLLYKYRLKGLWVILFTILVVALSDQISSSVIKPLVGRLRPCNEPGFMDQVRLLVHCGSGKSFPSSHASNHFGMAVFLGFCFKNNYKWTFPVLLLWAALISYAQVYVGVHYPIDVLCGAILGATIGWLVFLAGKRILPQQEIK